MKLSPKPAGTVGHAGRGLCRAGYARASRDGSLVDYERRNRPYDVFAEEYAMLCSEGYTNSLIAQRLNISADGVRSAVRHCKSAARVA